MPAQNALSIGAAPYHDWQTWQLNAAIVYLLRKIAGSTQTPDQLVQAAACFNCLDLRNLMILKTYMLSTIMTGGTPAGVPLIPAMTSDTAPSGTVSSNAGTGQFTSGGTDWNPFSGNSASSGALWSVRGGPNATFAQGWDQYAFSSAKLAHSYSMASAISFGNITATTTGWIWAPTSWILQGSNDGVTFTNLDTQTGVNWTSQYELQNFTIQSPGNYSTYRWLITGSNQDWNGGVQIFQGWQISQLQLFT